MMYREDLDALASQPCTDPTCTNPHSAGRTEVFLHAKCHDKAGTWSYYDVMSKSIIVICKACRARVAEVKVAGRGVPVGLLDALKA